MRSQRNSSIGAKYVCNADTRGVQLRLDSFPERKKSIALPAHVNFEMTEILTGRCSSARVKFVTLCATLMSTPNLRSELACSLDNTCKVECFVSSQIGSEELLFCSTRTMASGPQPKARSGRLGRWMNALPWYADALMENVLPMCPSPCSLCITLYLCERCTLD